MHLFLDLLFFFSVALCWIPCISLCSLLFFIFFLDLLFFFSVALCWIPCISLCSLLFFEKPKIDKLVIPHKRGVVRGLHGVETFDFAHDWSPNMSKVWSFLHLACSFFFHLALGGARLLAWAPVSAPTWPSCCFPLFPSLSSPPPSGGLVGKRERGREGRALV